MVLSISVIIPTVGRHRDLKNLLNSIREQVVVPERIVVVDQSDDQLTRELCENYTADLGQIYYVHSVNKSLTASRNLGIDCSLGYDFVAFLDDDIILDEDYFKNAYTVLSEYPQINLLVGWMKNQKKPSALENTFRFLLGFTYQSSRACVRRNLYLSNIRDKPKCIVPIEHANGTMIVRTQIASNLRFDEKLVKYGLSEDKDFSYRVYKSYGNLFMSPRLLYYHNESIASRLPNRKKLFMERAHTIYLFYKNSNAEVSRKVLLFWNWSWRFLGGLVLFLFRPKLGKNIICSYLYALKHWKPLSRGNLESLYRILDKEE